MTPLERRRFDHRIIVVTMDPRWTTTSAAATLPVRAGEDYRGYIRLVAGDAVRYAFVGGRGHWLDGGQPVSAGLLFEVSSRLRIDPRSYPPTARGFARSARSPSPVTSPSSIDSAPAMPGDSDPRLDTIGHAPHRISSAPTPAGTDGPDAVG